MTNRAEGNHVVVVGGGFAGLGAAHAARQRLSPADRVTLISRSPIFFFTPSLIWTLFDRPATHSTFFLEDALTECNISFVRANVREVRVAQRDVVTDEGVIPYDRLVIATGGRPDSSTIPGIAGEFRSAAWIAGEDSAMDLRNILRELIAQPGPVVVGAAQGASYISAAYEIALLIDSQLRHAGVRNRAPMSFVTAEPRVGDLGFGQSAAPQVLSPLLAERGIDMRVNTAIQRVAPGAVVLAGGEELEAAVSVLMPPMGGAVDIWKSAKLTDEDGLIPIDAHYRHLGYSDIYAAGVGCYFARPVPPLESLSAPHTGYLSLRMGVAAGQNLAASLGYGEGAERPLPFVLDMRVLDGGDDGVLLSSWGNNVLHHMARRLSGSTARAMKEEIETNEMHALRSGSVPTLETAALDRFAKLGQEIGALHRAV